MGEEFPHLQSHLQALTKQSSFSSNDIVNRLQEEESLIKRHAEQGLSETTALMSNAEKGGRGTHQKLLCANCKRTNHSTNFCIHAGGKMAGKSIEEACTAQRAAQGKPPKETSAHVATAETPVTTATTNVSAGNPIIINGTRYFPESVTTTPVAETANVALHNTALAPGDLFEYHAFMAINDDLHMSVNWMDYSRPTESIDTLPIAYTSSSTSSCRTPAAHLREIPFVLHTSATCHISPERSNFKTLHPTPPHPVKGIGKTCIYTVGMGTVKLTIAHGHKITLDNILFILSSSMRLLSVLMFNRSGGYTSHFDSHSCCVTGRSGCTVLCGNVIEQKQLYELITFAPLVTHHRDPNHQPSALYTARVPNVETWHQRLGHCNIRTIIDMAKSQATKGMTIDLSTIPPKCTHCVLGKQTKSAVPKTQEGPKATRHLERVFVDLTCPMSVMSRTGKKYLMNIIDDFTSYIWSIPLSSKDEASKLLQIWQCTMENQTDDRLKFLVTDNGELISQSITDWCTSHGIEHKLTAPYTSAQNGRAERVHQTIMNKARSMRLACNAPATLWDEFCTTATYLTTLTASVTLKGTTLYEAWHAQPPSLTHLHEIGSRAFARIPTPQPKILRRSVLCVLIGYAPNAKAYRLWDPTSGRVFNTFHVSFIEHLDTAPMKYLPGETVHDNTPATWNTLSDVHAEPSSGISTLYRPPPALPSPRSEEHTSELQSHV